MTRVLVVDNHDSFVHTLVGYLRELGADTTLVESDVTTAAEVERLLADHDALLLSPGPGDPTDAGVSLEAVRIAAGRGTPTLGVCLGHQTIGQALGAPVTAARELMHGMVSSVEHDGSALFDGIPSPFDAGRYHSLALEAADLPAEVAVTAWTADGTVMALAHRKLPFHGVQFHPESVLTQGGYRLLANWLRMSGDPAAVGRSAGLHPLAR
jgi:para-aminobenzoate synthetase component 2